jgi:hypothetical protein
VDGVLLAVFLHAKSWRISCRYRQKPTAPRLPRSGSRGC